MTRAKQHLALMVPLRFHVGQQHRLGDRHLYGGLSRFIPPEVAALFERVATSGGGAVAEPIRMPQPSALRLRLGAIWD